MKSLSIHLRNDSYPSLPPTHWPFMLNLPPKYISLVSDPGIWAKVIVLGDSFLGCLEIMFSFHTCVGIGEADVEQMYPSWVRGLWVQSLGDKLGEIGKLQWSLSVVHPPSFLHSIDFSHKLSHNTSCIWPDPVLAAGDLRWRTKGTPAPAQMALQVEEIDINKHRKMPCFFLFLYDNVWIIESSSSQVYMGKMQPSALKYWKGREVFLECKKQDTLVYNCDMCYDENAQSIMRECTKHHGRRSRGVGRTNLDYGSHGILLEGVMVKVSPSLKFPFVSHVTFWEP